MRLIDADALLSGCKLAQEQISYDRQYANAFYSAGGHVSTEWWYIEDMIEDAPTIEPERKKGKWIKIPEFCGDDVSGFIDNHFSCSECKKEAEINSWGFYILSNFCPNCGAEMREGEEE